MPPVISNRYSVTIKDGPLFQKMIVFVKRLGFKSPELMVILMCFFSLAMVAGALFLTVREGLLFNWLYFKGKGEISIGQITGSSVIVESWHHSVNYLSNTSKNDGKGGENRWPLLLNVYGWSMINAIYA